MSNKSNNNNEEKKSEQEVEKFQKDLDSAMTKRFYSSDTSSTDKSKEEKNNNDFLKYKSLREFGYAYNDNGELRSLENGEKFKFINQDHYDRFGYFVVREIQNKMLDKTKYKMREVKIPLDSEDPYKGNIFVSEDFEQNTGTLVMVICGSGQVKAGQWARSVCINDNLDNGSILPYLEKFNQLNYSSIVLNPNNNYYEVPLELADDDPTLPKELPKQRQAIKGSESPLKHLFYIFDNIISKSPAKKFIIIAHSYGGVITSELLDQRTDKLKDKLKLIALTDSVHSLSKKTTDYTRTFFDNSKKTRNWVRSDEPLGQDLGYSKIQGCQLYSSGHTVHEFTSGFCKSNLFEFITENK
ncbi:esterase/lipase/thioesterase domain-containing protein [Tieghemostelium lacteum]|uniref:Esterase/lipase/thioesterase domain-containing protein n=1 Tax=Tieghemostelium lacteum TaxID=361077 RepID=A0A151Z6Y8_TIELA|nr:esterase/lipase/thioesterase domain-containing protein [Tieghemostelium lacteum]|eukprot:KYQ89731.1 esterase/lipase/thioesterase domain-containing protein [Tieghemostelium lacteum]